MVVDPVDPLVARMTRAHFPTEQMSEALDVLEAYAGSERTRVHLAMLKLADASLDRLRDGLALAETDPRDVLAGAEFPRQMAHTPAALQAMRADERRAIEEADRQEYLAWLAAAAGEED